MSILFKLISIKWVEVIVRYSTFCPKIYYKYFVGSQHQQRINIGQTVCNWKVNIHRNYYWIVKLKLTFDSIVSDENIRSKTKIRRLYRKINQEQHHVEVKWYIHLILVNLIIILDRRKWRVVQDYKCYSIQVKLKEWKLSFYLITAATKISLITMIYYLNVNMFC